MAKVIDTKDSRVAAYLEQYGTIQPFEAWAKLGIYRLSACIFNLKKSGYTIETQLVEVKNKFKEVCRIAEYRLVTSIKSGKPKANVKANVKASAPLKATPTKKATALAAAFKEKVSKPPLVSKPVATVAPKLVAVVPAQLQAEYRLSIPDTALKRIIEESNYNPAVRSRYPAPSIKRY